MSDFMLTIAFLLVLGAIWEAKKEIIKSIEENSTKEEEEQIYTDD